MKHSVIDLWATEHGLSLDTRGARRQVALTVDKVRLHMREQASGHVLLQARVADIPAAERPREDMLLHALGVAAGRMRSSACVLATDLDADSLHLQLQAALGSDVQALDLAVEHLVNEVEVWRLALGHG
jgi:hypothetical protein